MIKTENLVYSYNGKDIIFFPDLACRSSEILLLLGKSGVGKSTLLHLIGGLMQIQKGSIWVDDQDLGELTIAQLDDFRGKNIGIIFQVPHFVSSISVIENLMLAQSLAGEQVDGPKCQYLLDSLSIGYKANEKPANLSQGEKQRLSIARAIINRPKVILADEPTSALDDENTELVVKLLKKEAEEINAALVIVTHDTRLKDIIPNQVTLA